jgi:hypothetical protein
MPARPPDVQIQAKSAWSPGNSMPDSYLFDSVLVIQQRATELARCLQQAMQDQ